MAGIIDYPQATDNAARETRLTWLTAVFAVVASFAMLLSATPGTVSPVAYWTVTSIALATVLIVFVAGECAWDRMVDRARAAGVVGR
ncbi:hypothetical protein NWT09_24190 [Mycolicibacterium sp. jd]|jgi:hypothetical protein